MNKACCVFVLLLVTIVELLETKPIFTTPLKDITVPEEQSVNLECELSKPSQKVKWFKDGKEVKPDRKRNIVAKVDGTKHSLTIPKSLTGDTAQYSVKCGEQETEGKLTVEGRSSRGVLLLLSLINSFLCKRL